MCRVWSSHHITNGPSVSMVCAAILDQDNILQVRQSHIPQISPLALLKQITCGRNKISSRRANPGEFGEVSARNPNKGDSRILPSMETMLDNVFGFRMKLFRKRLNTELMCCHFLFIA